MNNLIEVWVDMPNIDKPDKGWPHAYILPYSLMLAGYKDKPITMCELGVAGGQSMKMWDAYFTHPDTKIYGLDCDLAQLPSGFSLSSRCTLIDASTSHMDKTILNDLKFDFVLDDASHDGNLQKIAFEFFQPKMNDNGLIIIEDILDRHILNMLLELDKNNFYIDTRGVNRWQRAPNDDGIVHFGLVMAYYNAKYPDGWVNYNNKRPTKINFDY